MSYLIFDRYYFDPDEISFWKVALRAIAFSVLASIIIWFLDEFLQNIRRLKLWFLLQVIHRRKKVRFSMSYLYRIRIDDKYLLVKNSKWEFFQFVGGVYKVLPHELDTLQEKYGAEPDKKLSTSGVKKDDLRVFVPATKALKFLDWFISAKNREVSHWREFCEELIRTEVLDFSTFPHVNYRFVGTVQTPLKKSQKFNCLELLRYDVYDLKPSAEQEEALRKLKEKGDTEYIKWVDEQIIMSLGFDNVTKSEPFSVGIHTKWAVNMKYESP
ncbi:SMODS-associated NUDIX domain-containing protein [Halocola ammonii]